MDKPVSRVAAKMPLAERIVKVWRNDFMGRLLAIA
jgi:hypothetical protein